MGLISKHGILIVQFANQLQRAGRTKRDAIEEAAAVRLRPILMTTAAMVLGVVPLVIAAGAGAAGRHAMGLVIFSGLSIGTLFTLFVVPAVYMLLGADHHTQPDSPTASEAPCRRRPDDPLELPRFGAAVTHRGARATARGSARSPQSAAFRLIFLV